VNGGTLADQGDAGGVQTLFLFRTPTDLEPGKYSAGVSVTKSVDDRFPRKAATIYRWPGLLPP
jgi:hypothetical protein